MQECTSKPERGMRIRASSSPGSSFTFVHQLLSKTVGTFSFHICAISEYVVGTCLAFPASLECVLGINLGVRRWEEGLTIMHAFALIGSRNLVVVMPSGSCYRNERKNETVSDKPGIQGSKRKTGNSLTSYNTSFVTHVLFKIQE